MNFCDCEESRAAGMMAMITQTLIRVEPYNLANARAFVTTCAHCSKVLGGLDYGFKALPSGPPISFFPTPVDRERVLVTPLVYYGRHIPS